MSEPITKTKSHPTHETRTFTGRIFLDKETQKKRFVMDHPMYYQHEINKFGVGDLITMSLTSKKPKRSEAQNRYMHLYFSLIALPSGHTTEEIKNWAKGKFLAKGITEIFKEKVRKIKDTSKLTIPEMIEFIARVEAHTGIAPPDPTPFKLPLTYNEFKKLKEIQREKYLKMNPLLH